MTHDERRLQFQFKVLDSAIGILTEHAGFLISGAKDLDPEFLSIFRTTNTEAVGPLVDSTVEWLRKARSQSGIDAEAITIATYMVAMSYRLAVRLGNKDIADAMRASYDPDHVDWCVTNFNRNRLAVLPTEGRG